MKVTSTILSAAIDMATKIRELNSAFICESEASFSDDDVYYRLDEARRVVLSLAVSAENVQNLEKARTVEHAEDIKSFFDLVDGGLLVPSIKQVRGQEPFITYRLAE
jgi:hypothetical protein